MTTDIIYQLICENMLNSCYLCAIYKLISNLAYSYAFFFVVRFFVVAGFSAASVMSFIHSS